MLGRRIYGSIRKAAKGVEDTDGVRMVESTVMSAVGGKARNGVCIGTPQGVTNTQPEHHCRFALLQGRGTQ